MAATRPIRADGHREAATMLATLPSTICLIFTLLRRRLALRSSIGKVICLLVLCCGGALPPAYGLEKYGRPLPSMEEQGDGSREAEESLFGGYLLAAPFVSNPTFAARPDNTGLVGMRYMAHLEMDIYKQYLTFYTDQNFFSDRKNGWIELSEWDMTYALTGLVGRWGWRLQYERDAPLDKSGLKQVYADALATGNLHAADDFSWWRKYFPHQNLNAYAGFGWLFHNSNYFARPDNTGRALFRYVAHVDLDLYKNKVVLYGDTNFFTDRELSNKLKPTELDWIVGLAFRFKDDYEISVYREQDLSLDKPGTLIQEYWAVQLRFAFDVPKRFLRELTSH
jgi:hypothetical protein